MHMWVKKKNIYILLPKQVRIRLKKQKPFAQIVVTLTGREMDASETNL